MKNIYGDLDKKSGIVSTDILFGRGRIQFAKICLVKGAAFSLEVGIISKDERAEWKPIKTKGTKNEQICENIKIENILYLLLTNCNWKLDRLIKGEQYDIFSPQLFNRVPSRFIQTTGIFHDENAFTNLRRNIGLIGYNVIRICW